MIKKKIAVLGASGSIGKSALEVIRGASGDFEPVLFANRRNADDLAKLGKEFPNARLVLTSETGDEVLLEAIAGCGADIAINGISGAAGLPPSMAVLESGGDLALANKETVVMAGRLVFEKAAEKKAKIVPVDSEHWAVFNLLEKRKADDVEEIILTASGGPFRNKNSKELASVTPAQALSHPTWNMGPKITVDSASLANKGLEVIEAACLFNMPPEKIRVLVHPQSVVNSMIQMKDGAVYAQLSRPDMKLPIRGALYWPETAPSAIERLDFEGLTLEFSDPEGEKFPMLPLAYAAVRLGGLYPCVYNGANEEAAAAFLAGEAGFLDIPRIVEYVLSREWDTALTGISAVLEADRRSRDFARDFIKKKGKGKA
jgi:1-deoxy-D-xylulose-5-phosphate reductoisomerase